MRSCKLRGERARTALRALNLYILANLFMSIKPTPEAFARSDAYIASWNHVDII